MKLPPGLGGWETTCILSGGYNMAKRREEEQSGTGQNNGDGREGWCRNPLVPCATSFDVHTESWCI